MQNNWKNIGEMSFRKNLILIGCVLLSFHSLGQKRKKKEPEKVVYPQVTLVGKDTLMLFTLDQTKQMAKDNEERKKLKQVVFNQNSQMKFKDSIILMQETQLTDLKLIKFDYDLIVEQMKVQQQICSDEKAVLNREIRKQRRHKIYAISGGILSFGTMLYFYIYK